MKVKVRFFSIYKDIAKTPVVDVEIEEGATVKSLLERLAKMFPRLGGIFSEIQPIVLVDGEIANEDKAIESSMEIAIAPPASGGLDIKTSVFRDDVSIDRVVEELLISEDIGAIAIFVGVVKGVAEGHRVYELDYDVYEPHASKALEKIAKDEMGEHNLYAVQIHHRAGPARPGQKTIVIAVASSSRKNALEALRDILERVKTEVPIYKLEKRDDGEYWVIGDGKRIPRSRDEQPSKAGS